MSKGNGAGKNRAANTAAVRRKLAEEAAELRHVKLHGHDVHYRQAGDGPTLVLLHGITSSGDCWRDVMPTLAQHYRVIAPDLLGHGQTAKPQGDYSLGAYAAGVRDLLAVLSLDSGTVVGHSFGGGIAMQFSYLFTEYVERMVLVSSGGLGKTVHPFLRAATLPGSEWVLPMVARDGASKAGASLAKVAARLGLEAGPDLAEFARGYASLSAPGATQAFLHTMKGVIGPAGQRVSALDRLYLADQIPTMIMWGDVDPIIPVEHGRHAHTVVPGSRYVEFEGSGHWPMLDKPQRFADELISFIEETEPFKYNLKDVRKRLIEGPKPAQEHDHSKIEFEVEPDTAH